MTKTITIEGMSCGHCKARVEKALGALAGVQSVEVNLDKKEALVTIDETVSDGTLKAAVEEAGYEVAGIA